LHLDTLAILKSSTKSSTTEKSQKPSSLILSLFRLYRFEFCQAILSVLTPKTSPRAFTVQCQPFLRQIQSFLRATIKLK